MTNLQLYIAVGIPTLAVISSPIISLVTISGIQSHISGIQSQISELRHEMNELRRELNTKIDLLTGKVYELMAKE